MAAMYPKLVIDGSFGPVTIKALQMYLKHKASTYRHTTDGQFGYYTALGMQHWLNNRGYYNGYLDGSAGTMTWEALHVYLKSTGRNGSYRPYSWIEAPLCRRLQDFLNANRWY